MEDEITTAEQEDPTRVSMSERTRARLGPIADRIGAWTQSDHVVVVSERDIRQPSRGPKSMGPRLSQSTILRKNFERMSGEEFGFTNTESFDRAAQNRYAQDVAEKIDNGEHFAASGRDSGVADMIGVSTSFDKAEFFEDMTGISARNFRNIPGLDRDWQAAVLMHEAKHLDSGASFSRNVKFEHEVASDEFMLSQYSKELALGTVTEPSVPENFMHGRAIGSFSGLSGSTHITNAALAMPGEGAAQQAVMQPTRDGLLEAQIIVMKQMGIDANPDNYKTQAMEIIISSPFVDKGAAFGMTPNEIQAASQGLARNDPAVMAGLESRLRERNPTIYDEFKDMVASDMQQTLHEASKDNPELFYESSRISYLRGDFEGNPVGQQFAYEFLQGAKAIASDYFGADANEVIPAPQTDENAANPPVLGIGNALQNGLNR